jgi:hypothetical protein
MCNIFLAAIIAKITQVLASIFYQINKTLGYARVCSIKIYNLTSIAILAMFCHFLFSFGTVWVKITNLRS